MDTRDGRIYPWEEVERMAEADRQYMRPMEHHPTPEQRATGKVGRNDNCPCGSGKKFKRCCLWRHESAKRQGMTFEQMQEAVKAASDAEALKGA